MPGFFSFSRRLDWELTTRCNLSCAHCISRIFHTFHGLSPSELTPAGATRVVDRCAEAGIDRIHFFGGEPTLRGDFPELLQRADRLGIETSFSTNATRLTDRLLRAWSSLRHRRPAWVSFEDIRPGAADAIRGPGSFEAALRGARALARAGGETGFVAAFTVTRPALEQLEPVEILEFFAELGARHLVFQDLAAPSDAPPELARLALDGELWLGFLERLFDPELAPPMPFTYHLKPLVIEHLNARLGTEMPVAYNGCNALSTELRLLPDGTLLPCSAAIGWPEALRSCIDEAPKLGERSLDEVLGAAPYQRFLARKTERGADSVMEPCRRCHLAYVRCNPCVFGRLTGDPHRVETCAWVKEAEGD